MARTLLASVLLALIFLASPVLQPAMADDAPTQEEGKKDKKEKKGEGTLCEQYSTCNECIAGQQGKGKGKGEAETECSLAAAGCWATWEKPVVCGDGEKKKEKKEKKEKKKAE